jgi:hexosaminidase
MIIPIVKKETEHQGVCAIPKTITCGGEGALARLGGDALASFAQNAEWTDGKAFVEFRFDNTLEDKAEIYRVTVLQNRIEVAYRDERGAVNGAATVALLLRKKELSCREIVDFPDCEYRSILLDLARGVPEKEELFSAIRYMALAKFNRVHLHLMETNGLCFVADSLPEYHRLDEGGLYDKSFLREVAELCRSYAMEIIPEIEIPAHARAVTAAYPEFMCTAEGAQGWAICPGAEGVFEFYDKLIGEVIDLFPDCKYVHIGTDELEFGELGLHHHCFWDECPRCAELRRREGLKDLREEFYYLVERMHEIVKSHGKKMMMWNDQIDVSRDVPISRDILIHFWRVAAPGRGPVEGCSMQGFLEKGFRVVNSFYRYVYLDQQRYLSAEKMKTWNVYNTPEQSPEYADQVLGGESTVWMYADENYPFCKYIIFSVFPIFGDKVWDKSDREHTEEYRRALSEYIFGSDDFTCIFDCIGDLIPPRETDIFVAPEAEMPSRELVETCLEKLAGIQEPSCLEAARKYTHIMNKIREQVEN